MISYAESTPYIIIITIATCIFIGKGIKKKDEYTLDVLLAIAGFVFGIFMTFMNLKYTSGELFLLSPLIAITSILYLRFREKIIVDEEKITSDINSSILKKVNIIFWLLLSFAVIFNHLTPSYQRSPVFFIIVSICIALVGFEIIYTNIKSNGLIWYIIIKILVLSFLLSASSYFLSPYPIGSDPWSHAEYIKDFVYYGKLAVKPGVEEVVSSYYVLYPFAHLLGTTTTLISDINIKNSMYVIGSVLTLSGIFTYSIAKEITKSTNIALFSMLLLNVSCFHLQWSIEVIAMSYALAIYALSLYLFIIKTKQNPIYKALMILSLITIIWAHTISSFILLISITILTFSSKIIDSFQKEESNSSDISVVLLSAVILISHWTDIRYPFFNMIVAGLVSSISAEAEFLGAETFSNIVGSWNSLYTYCGNLSYIFFGIIGTLYALSKRDLLTKNMSLICMILTLYAFRYIFPVFGLRNIIPDRWPPFIFITFTVFIAVGFYKFISLTSNKNRRIALILILLFSSSFLMITNNSSNKDSPVYGEDTSQRYTWTESEMSLFQNINELYKGTIVADEQTSLRPFGTYLQRDFEHLKFYELNKEGEINLELMDGNLIIWRKISLNRPITVSPTTEMLLGNSFKKNMDSRYNCISDVGEAKAYLI